MSSSAKTPLGFNIWSGTDTPKMEDFNSDNRITNDEISRLDAKIDDIKPPENVAIKDGTLQVNLNAEMLGGKKIDDLGADGIGQNLLINGAFQVWQRTTTKNNPNNEYVCDRYKVNGTGTVSRATANGGMTITGNINLRYIMEDLDYAQIADKTVTMSYSKDGIIITDTYQSDRYETVTGGRVVVSLDLSNCTIDWIKLEIGDKATPLISRLIMEELVLCQRYYEKSYGQAVQPGTPSYDGTITIVLATPTVAAPQSFGTFNYMATKRIAPTVTIFSPATGTIGRLSDNNGLDIPYDNSGTPTLASDRSFSVYNASGNSFNAVRNTLNFQWTADAEL